MLLERWAICTSHEVRPRRVPAQELAAASPMPAAASEESGALVEQDGLAMLCDRRLIDAPGAWLFDAQGWRVRAPGAEDHLRDNALLLMPTDALERLAEQLTRAQPLLGALVAEPSLARFFGVLARSSQQAGQPASRRGARACRHVQPAPIQCLSRRACCLRV